MVTELNISQAELIKILSDNYGLNIEMVTFLPKGEVSWGYIVQDRSGEKLFLKIHKSQNLVVDRFQLLHDLHANAGIKNIVFPKPTKKGELEILIQNYPSVIFNFVEGETAQGRELTSDQYEKLGRLLGQIHQAYKIVGDYKVKENFDIPQKLEFNQVMAEIEKQPIYEGEIRQKALKLFTSLKERFYNELVELEKISESLKKADVQYVLCHGEPSPGNIMITPEGEIYLIDWDEPIMAPKEKDLLFLNKHLTEVFQGYSQYSRDTIMNSEVEAFYGHLWNVAEIADWGGRLFLYESSEEELKHSLEQLENFLGYSGLSKDYSGN